jgi:hypothetical protein
MNVTPIARAPCRHGTGQDHPSRSRLVSHSQTVIWLAKPAGVRSGSTCRRWVQPVIWQRLPRNCVLYRLDSSIIHLFRSACVGGLSQRFKAGYPLLLRKVGSRTRIGGGRHLWAVRSFSPIASSGECVPTPSRSGTGRRLLVAFGEGPSWVDPDVVEACRCWRRPISGEERLHRMGAGRRQRERVRSVGPVGERVRS